MNMHEIFQYLDENLPHTKFVDLEFPPNDVRFIKLIFRYITLFYFMSYVFTNIYIYIYTYRIVFIAQADKILN